MAGTLSQCRQQLNSSLRATQAGKPGSHDASSMVTVFVRDFTAAAASAALAVALWALDVGLGPGQGAARPGGPRRAGAEPLARY